MELRSRVSVPPAGVIRLLQSHHEPKKHKCGFKKFMVGKELDKCGDFQSVWETDLCGTRSQGQF